MFVRAPWGQILMGGGYYKIIQHSNGLAVAVQYASTSGGAAIVLQPYSGSDDQLWQITVADSGYYSITNKHSGNVLAVTADGTTNGTKIIQWPNNGKTSQHWKFQSA